MDEELKDILLIEQYLQNNLTGSDLESFELRLKNDPQFKNLFDDTQLLINGIRKKGSHEQLEELRQLELSLPEIIPTTISKQKWLNNKTIMRLAASLALLIVAATVWFQYQATDHQAIFKENFVAYSNEVVQQTRNSEPNINSIRNQAYLAYDNRKYIESVKLFAQLPDSIDAGSHIFYSGICYLSMDQPTLAAESFRKYIKLNQVLNNQAHWYLGLTYVRLEQIDLATEQFKFLTDQNNSYSSRSQHILDLLKGNQ